MRGRPVENRWIGMRMSEPDFDLAGLARSQGAQGIGPVRTVEALAAALREGVAAVAGGRGGRDRRARGAGILARGLGFADAPHPGPRLQDVRAATRRSLDARLPKQRALYLRRRLARVRGETRDPGHRAGDRRVARHRWSTPRADDVDLAVKAAREAFYAWRDTPAQERAKAVRKAAAILLANADELAWLEALDTGNPFQAMRFDVEISAGYMEYFAGLVTEIKGDTIPIGAGTLNYTLREPLGVVGRIGAFNHPLLFTAGKCGAPLVTGNTLVVKPADQTPLSSLRIAELWHDVFPPGVFNVVTGGRDAGVALVAHPKVAKIGFIGSVPAGRAVMSGASATLKALTLELGGKNALIACADATPEEIGDGVVRGMNFRYVTGQSCNSTSRVFLHDAIYDKALAEIVKKVSQIKVGLPTERDTEMSCLTSQAQYDKTMSYIKLGRRRRRAPCVRRQAAGRSRARQGLLRRADGVRRRHRRHAHRARGDLRAGGEHPALVGRERHARARERARRRAHLLDLDARPRPRASSGVAGRGGLRVDQRRVARITSACRSAATSSRGSAARSRSRSSWPVRRSRTSTSRCDATNGGIIMTSRLDYRLRSGTSLARHPCRERHRRRARDRQLRRVGQRHAVRRRDGQGLLQGRRDQRHRPHHVGRRRHVAAQHAGGRRRPVRRSQPGCGRVGHPRRRRSRRSSATTCSPSPNSCGR